MSVAVRVTELAYKTLREAADATGESLQTTLGKAIEVYRRELFLERANTAYERLREDRDLWRQEIRERSLWARADEPWE